MNALSILQEVEDFLRKDLAGEVLSTRSKTKRSNLLTKVSESIVKIKEEDKLEEFLAKQRQMSREQSSENGKKYGSDDDEDEEDHYMDLTEIPSSAFDSNNLSPPVADDYGSGSGYESYASDEDISAKTKSNKDEDLSAYFSTSECDVFTYIYIESKNKFLKGKKWVKRVGIVKENHLKFFKKPTDSTALLDIPLRGYNATLKRKEATTLVAVILSTASGGEAYRFHVERNELDEWTKVLREKTLSVRNDANLPPPPVAARPVNTLPRLPTETRNDRTKSLGDINILITDTSPPPIPPGHPSLPQQNPQNISKGLKMAVTDMFKKDKTKKKIMTAENLGADVCGHLMVFDNKWVKKWCLINQNQLLIYGKEEAPELQIELQGCDLLPHCEDKDRPFGFKILRGGKELVYLEASSSDELGKWVGTLIAETGCAEVPETEPDYLPMDIRKDVMKTTKQAFDQRKSSIQKKTGKSTFFQDDQEEENIYLDLDSASQYPKQKPVSPQKILSPPLPPSAGRHSKSHSISAGVSLQFENGKSVQNAKKTSPVGDEKVEELNSQLNKAKTKQKKKGKNVRRHLTEPSIKTPIDVRDRDIIVIREPLPVDDPKDEESKNEGNRSAFENIVEKRKREYMRQKADMKTQILTLSVKKLELNKYIEAASTERERERLRKMLQKATDDLNKLEEEDAHIETELKKLKEKTNIESPANKRPPPRKPINTGASGNVMSKAQMWEAASKK